jgi:hypothetical protein
MCDHCREIEEKLLHNITPEVELFIEQLAAGVASKVQDVLAEKLPAGLPRALNHVVGAAAIGSLAEGFAKSLPRDRLDLAARLTVRIVETSDRLKAEHEKASRGGLGGLMDALRKSGVPVSIEAIGATEPGKG